MQKASLPGTRALNTRRSRGTFCGGFGRPVLSVRKYLFENLVSGTCSLEQARASWDAVSRELAERRILSLHWLLAPLGPIRGITLSALLHLIWAGLGMYVLSGGWDAVRAGVLAGVTFELSQWVIAWMQLPSLPMTVSWIRGCSRRCMRRSSEGALCG